MAMNPLPPQAYTKETLLRAYSWLQNQSPAIRELATTPDMMVSLFLKANRDGDGALDRPSIQNFKNELKNLAGMMGELEPPERPKENVQPKPPTFHAEAEKAQQASALDELSIQMLNEIKTGFNLSSQTEALRLVIKLGYLKAQKILTE